MTRLETFFLASGLVLTTATQLRISGLPIGPGEVLCLIWLLLQLPALIRERGSLWADTTIRGFVLFWGVMFFAMAAGSIKGLAHPAWDAHRGAHDALAYMFASLISIAALARFRRHTAEAKHLLFLVLLIALSLNIGLWLMAKSQLGTMSAMLMHSPLRFQGLANNPNQLAMLMVSLPFIGWYFIENSASQLVKLLNLLSMGVAVFVGLQTGSDALKVSLLFGVGVLAIAIAYSMWYGQEAWKWRIAALGIVLCAYVVSGLPFAINNSEGLAEDVATNSAGLSENVATNSGRLAQNASTNSAKLAENASANPAGLAENIAAISAKLARSIAAVSAELSENIAADKSVRFSLWIHAIQAWMEAPIFGLGPGAWSGTMAPYEGVEAHNSFLDLGMSAGIVGLIAYLGILYWLSLHFLVNRCHALLAIFVVMILYSMFHYILRHPFFWVILATSLCLCTRNNDTKKLEASGPRLEKSS